MRVTDFCKIGYAQIEIIFSLKSRFSEEIGFLGVFRFSHLVTSVLQYAMHLASAPFIAFKKSARVDW
ncbi:MAG: hypothetical protein A2007_03260 [Verrucomicrobia bacterium GWC2_42_7]|nr:MAG: hypothetical protein A2007_03260 [Verrucomicrobia bacterium GWC2_42_7]